MSTEQVDPRLEKIYSHAAALMIATKEIRNDIDAGRIEDASLKTAQAEGVARRLLDLIGELGGRPPETINPGRDPGRRVRGHH